MCEIIQKDNIKDTEVFIVSNLEQVKEQTSHYIDGGLIAILYDIKFEDYERYTQALSAVKPLMTDLNILGEYEAAI